MVRVLRLAELRVSIGVENTERHHVEQLWDRMRASADAAVS